ncbi:MAG: hypothetical protein V2B20_17115 [Pseudomonadota bacterium]
MKDTHTFLNITEIQNTIEKLYLRISDRFPNSGLSCICTKLHDISLEMNATLQWIAKPNYPLRIFTYAIIFGILLATILSISSIHFASSTINISDLIQMLGSGLEGTAIACAGIIFIITFENKRKRTKIISSINRLRCISHTIDMHQLTKDPDAIKMVNITTPHSPKRELKKHELGRYLNYCSEMLSLTSKLGFLYIQDFPDPIATDAVNDLENLTNGLSRKTWQKIMLIDKISGDMIPAANNTIYRINQ